MPVSMVYTYPGFFSIAQTVPGIRESETLVDGSLHWGRSKRKALQKTMGMRSEI